MVDKKNNKNLCWTDGLIPESYNSLKILNKKSELKFQ